MRGRCRRGGREEGEREARGRRVEGVREREGEVKREVERGRAR